MEDVVEKTRSEDRLKQNNNDIGGLTAELKRFIEKDWSWEFTRTIKNIIVLLELDTPSCSLDVKEFGSKVLFLICESNAVNCAEALLKGETGLTVDLNGIHFRVDDGWCYPLHYVARKLHASLPQLFIEYGADPNARCSDGSLPIELALQELRWMVWWTTEQSVHRLLFCFCAPAMHEPAMTVYFLTNSLSIPKWSELVSRYVVERKIIELAALLIMTPEFPPRIEKMYFPTNDHFLTDKMTLRHYVVNQIVLLMNEESKLEGIKVPSLADHEQQMEAMMAIMLLLETFYMKGYEIKMYFTGLELLPSRLEAVVGLLLSSSFELTGDDALLITNEIKKKVGHTNVKSLMEVKSRSYSFASDIPVDAMVKTDVDNFLADSSDSNESENQMLLALHGMLGKISSDIIMCKWTRKEPIIKLITVLCSPEVTEALEVIKLHVQNIEKIHDIACYYAKEDKLIELGILLMVAREKIMDQITVEIEDNSTKVMTFRQLINSELAQLIDLDYRLIGRKTKEGESLRRLCKRRMSSILLTFPLIEIFEKAGSAIEAYLESSLMKMDLKEIGSKDQKIKDITETHSGSQQQNMVLPPCSQLHGFPFIYEKSPFGMPSVIRRFILETYPRESETLLSSLQPYRTFWTSEASFHPVHQKTLEPRRKEAMARVKKHVPKVQGMKQMGPLALLLRRGIKYL